jgi:protein-tyrosine phosphatase
VSARRTTKARAAPAFQMAVDFLPESVLPVPGRLGMTHVPGAWGSGRDVDSDVRLREDLAAIAGVHAAKVLVTLLERMEVAEVGDLAREARRARLRWIHFPIADGWVPSDEAAAGRLVGRILRALERGHDVVVHCWAGMGRTGMIGACCLVARGMPPEEAIAVVRATRDGTIQTAAQEEFVRSFATPAK